jgi:hypothetical protein
MAKTRSKSFEKWLYEEVEQSFGLKRLRTHILLDELSTLVLPVDEPNRNAIEVLRLRLFDYVDSWNEDEIKFLFISPFINLVNYMSDNYKIFMQRTMSVQYDNGTKTTIGKVEFMIAKGKQIPQKPFFFFTRI